MRFFPESESCFRFSSKTPYASRRPRATEKLSLKMPGASETADGSSTKAYLSPLTA